MKGGEPTYWSATGARPPFPPARPSSRPAAGEASALGLGEEIRRFRYDEPRAAELLGAALADLLAARCRPGEDDLVLLCIGTDRSTGDALGPLVGRVVERFGPAGLQVYGTLDQPVHASNLGAALEAIQAAHGRACLIAVDACLGRLESVGCIAVGPGPLLPGAGVNKNLPEVGHVHVTGTVNVGGFMEYFVLQNTRLALVVRMAEVIGEGIARAAAALASGGPRVASAAR
jgi:putative sporulation protein YyaC